MLDHMSFRANVKADVNLGAPHGCMAGRAIGSLQGHAMSTGSKLSMQQTLWLRSGAQHSPDQASRRSAMPQDMQSMSTVPWASSTE